MAISNTVSNHLNRKSVEYQVIHHQPSYRSLESSRLANIDAKKVAKAVLLKDYSGYKLAVLPADRDIDIHSIRDEFGINLKMASEQELTQCFPDCEIGAVPAVGECYGITTIVDKSLQSLHDLYFEGGDHEDLVHVTEVDFERLVPNAKFGYISKSWQ